MWDNVYGSIKQDTYDLDYLVFEIHIDTESQDVLGLEILVHKDDLEQYEGYYKYILDRMTYDLEYELNERSKNMPLSASTINYQGEPRHV